MLTLLYAAVLILCVLAILLGICWLCIRWLGRREERYDERQKANLGTAYMIAFWVGIAYMGIMMLLNIDGPFEEMWLLILVGIMLMLMTQRFCRAILGVGSPLDLDPKVEVPCGIALICFALYDIFKWSVPKGASLGDLTERFWVDLMISICWLVLCGLDIGEYLAGKKE